MRCQNGRGKKKKKQSYNWQQNSQTHNYLNEQPFELLQIAYFYVLLYRVQYALMDDLNLVIQKAQKGDKDAYGQIYNIFYRRIYRYCKFNAKSAQIAQDICQETFLKAWKALPSFRERGGSLQAYLFKIARNLIIDFSRKKKEESLNNYQQIEADGKSLEDEIDKSASLNKIRNALAGLKEDERQIIILRYFEDMTQLEVAKVIGIKEGNLRVKTHRILKKLKEIIYS